jgi:hypothetical protein
MNMDGYQMRADKKKAAVMRAAMVLFRHILRIKWGTYFNFVGAFLTQ